MHPTFAQALAITGCKCRAQTTSREIQAEFINIRRSEERIQSLPESGVRGRRVVLNIGVSKTLAPRPITRFLRHVMFELPAVELVLHPVGAVHGGELVLSGSPDGCFMADIAATNPTLSIIDAFSERLQVASSEAHSFAKLTTVPIRALAEDVYLDRLNCEFRTRVVHHFMDNDVVMHPRLRSEREDWVQQAVAEGVGICMLPEFSTIVPRLVIRPVETIDLVRKISFVSVSESGAAQALRQMRKLLHDFDWMLTEPASKP